MIQIRSRGSDSNYNQVSDSTGHMGVILVIPREVIQIRTRGATQIRTRGAIISEQGNESHKIQGSDDQRDPGETCPMRTIK